jgi:hypothetical protein
VSPRPGRNDPCYCGSGKKYKRCHLPIDEQRQLAAPTSTPIEDAAEPLHPGSNKQTDPDGTWTAEDEFPEITPDWGKAPGGMKQFAHAFKMASRAGLFKRNPELRRMFKDNETLLNYLAHQDEIEAALKKLEPYHADFDRLCQDAAAFERQSQALFAEPAFVPFRFTAAELRKAFAEVGIPTLGGDPEKSGKLLRKALLFLATKERRDDLSMRLLLLMPDYVHQGRHLDALLIECCAQMTAEETNDANPFLGRMFLDGLQAWAAEQDASRGAVLEDAGFHLGPDADPEEIEKWLDKETTNPENAERWKRLIEAHPELQVNPEDSFQLMSRQAVDLFDREDAARLLLSADEIRPWDTLIVEKLQAMYNEVGLLQPGPEVSEAKSKKAFDQFYLPLMQEVAKGIFTPDRIRQLVALLRAYRKELAIAGDKNALASVTSAILYVEREREPEHNTFLLSLCARSVSKLGEAAEPEASDVGSDT